MQRIIYRLIVLTVFLVTLFCLVSFFSVDACMDAGGVWSNWGFTCDGAGSDFVPQFQRPVFFFWGLVTILSLIPSLLINKLLPNEAH